MPEDLLAVPVSGSVASELERVWDGVSSLSELPDRVDVDGDSTGGVGFMSSGSAVTTSVIRQAASRSALSRSAHSDLAMVDLMR